MAFDERLAARIRSYLARRSGVAERKMFGGIIFMLQGNMCCGVHRDALIARTGATIYADRPSLPVAWSSIVYTTDERTGMVVKNLISATISGLLLSAVVGS